MLLASLHTPSSPHHHDIPTASSLRPQLHRCSSNEMSSAFNNHHISDEDLSYIAHTQRTLTADRGLVDSPPSSSRRPSTSSTQSGNASISLDPRALSALSAHFDELLGAITTRVKLVRIEKEGVEGSFPFPSQQPTPEISCKVYLLTKKLVITTNTRRDKFPPSQSFLRCRSGE